MNAGRATHRNKGAAGKTIRCAIIVSRFNGFVTRKLLAGAMECLKDHDIRRSDVKIFRCPGAFELPQVANTVALTGEWDAVVCLGAVIRGETAHFEYVSSEAARGIQDVALRHGLPVVFGVLTTDTKEQALARAGGTQGNKGWDAALAALEMVSLLKSLKSRKKRER